MMLDLRKYGKPFIIRTENAIINFEKVSEMTLKVLVMGAAFDITFLSLEQMDEFISLFTGSLKNL